MTPHRVPQGAEVEVLMRLYGYRFTRTGGVAGAEASRDAADVAAAERLGWPVRAVERITPADALNRAIDAASVLTEDDVLGAFVAGLGSAPRGRQTVISFAWARQLVAAPTTGTGLPDCGLDATPSGNDVTEALLRLALGWAWNERPYLYVPDLEAAAEDGLPTPTDDDRKRLRTMLEVIAEQPEGTSVSMLEKEIARAKIVPGTDKYQRYGILIGLAEYGALPSSSAASWDRFVSATERAAAWQGGPRSDITPPLSGWRGGVRADKTSRLLAL
ncbi:hypothetical protein [Microbacterium oxydans]|nr:hypothetical protein [Microbacterium oxydans]